MNDFQSSKNRLLMEIVTAHHSYFRNRTKKEKLSAIANSNYYNVEKLIEETISQRAKKLGHPLGHVDGHGMDYDDYSDSKTCSITKGVKRGGYDYWRGAIRNVFSKRGDLRLIVYNGFLEELRYYFIPYQIQKKLVRSNSKRDINGSITMSYSTRNDTISRIEQFRMSSFDDLCLAESTVDHKIVRTLTGDLPEADVLAAHIGWTINTENTLEDFFT